MLKTLIRSLIVQWEKLISKIKRIQPIDGSSYGLLCIRTARYKGKTLELTDKSRLSKGDFIIEMHLSNIILAKGSVGNATVASDLQLFPYIRAELIILCKYLHSHELHTKIKAIGGMTIHGPGLRRFGFTLYPAQKNLLTALATIWMRILRWAFSHPREAVRLRNRPPKNLENFYMPISQFFQKYDV